jgi:hypothetical protein
VAGLKLAVPRVLSHYGCVNITKEKILSPNGWSVAFSNISQSPLDLNTRPRKRRSEKRANGAGVVLFFCVENTSGLLFTYDGQRNSITKLCSRKFVVGGRLKKTFHMILSA